MKRRTKAVLLVAGLAVAIPVGTVVVLSEALFPTRPKPGDKPKARVRRVRPAARAKTPPARGRAGAHISHVTGAGVSSTRPT